MQKSVRSDIPDTKGQFQKPLGSHFEYICSRLLINIQYLRIPLAKILYLESELNNNKDIERNNRYLSYSQVFSKVIQFFWILYSSR